MSGHSATVNPSLGATTTSIGFSTQLQSTAKSLPSPAIFSADRSSPTSPSASSMTYKEFCRSKESADDYLWLEEGPWVREFCKLDFSINREDISRFYLDHSSSQ